jgi:hypothetical protein
MSSATDHIALNEYYFNATACGVGRRGITRGPTADYYKTISHRV